MADALEVIAAVIGVGACVVGVSTVIDGKRDKRDKRGRMGTALLSDTGHLTSSRMYQLIQAVVEVGILRHYFLITPEPGGFGIIVYP